MSVNSSSSSFPPSLPPSNLSSTNIPDVPQNCDRTRAGTISIITFTVTNILLVLPLCIYVIYLGFQKWRQQRSDTTMSHPDIFTFHVVVIELINILLSILICCGVLTSLPDVIMLGLFFIDMCTSGQILFHSLTCVARYLAIVHPITYLGLRHGKGIIIRNISIGCIWLLPFVFMILIFMVDIHLIIIFYWCTSVFIFIVSSVCSISVLYVLIGPGPGAGGEGRPRVDESKMRAFYIIMAILGVLLLRFVGTTVNHALFYSTHVGESVKCGLHLATFWFAFPISLALPLLFLLSAGKLLCCKNSNTSGQGSD